jgi:ketol-acid reductoisomerase
MQADGTLQAQDKVIRESDLVMLLISDAAQANDYKKKIGEYIYACEKDFFLLTAVFSEPLLKKGATLGLSHGFLLGHLVRNISSAVISFY